MRFPLGRPEGAPTRAASFGTQLAQSRTEHTLAFPNFTTMIQTIRRSLATCGLAALSLFGAASCGGGGGGGGNNNAPSSVDFVLTDAAVDDLMAFTVRVTSLRLVSQTGGVLGPELLAAPLTIDLIGAGANPRWVGRDDVDDGVYRGVQLVIDPASTVALDRLGATVGVQHGATTFELGFPAPTSIDDDDYAKIVIDVDLGASLTGDVASPPIQFDPQGVVTLLGSGASTDIDEVEGLVTSTNSPSSLVIDAFADDDDTIAIGPVTVNISGSTVLLDDDGFPFASRAAFFATLILNSTELEVHGPLVGGSINATRIEVEDDGNGDAYVVKIDGRIENLDRVANTFDLVLIEIEKGASLAGPVLNGLGNPTTIACEYDDVTTVILLDDDDDIVDDNSLATGQRIKVKFPVFATSPFQAGRIEIEDQPEFEGRIQDISGLPNTIIIRLDDDDPAIANGQVDDAATDVTVNLANSTLFLDTEGRPTLTPSQLLVGLELEIYGTLSGASNAPTIAASRTKIHPGEFEGVVSLVFSQAGSFDATMIELDDPFGNTVTFGSVAVDFAPGCVFDGDATDAASFFALFNNLQQGEELHVEVEGIGTSTPNVIDAYEIEVEIEIDD
jgi:hypothetical protein